MNFHKVQTRANSNRMDLLCYFRFIIITYYLGDLFTEVKIIPFNYIILLCWWIYSTVRKKCACFGLRFTHITLFDRIISSVIWCNMSRGRIQEAANATSYNIVCRGHWPIFVIWPSEQFYTRSNFSPLWSLLQRGIQLVFNVI